MGAARLVESALQQNGWADAVEFLRWRWKHGLSLTVRPKPSDYRGGKCHITPAANIGCRAPLLACKGGEAERQAAA
jgi:hypothetical protein